MQLRNFTARRKFSTWGAITLGANRNDSFYGTHIQLSDGKTRFSVCFEKSVAIKWLDSSKRAVQTAGGEKEVGGCANKHEKPGEKRTLQTC